jgi:hypothetical protein
MTEISSFSSIDRIDTCALNSDATELIVKSGETARYIALSEIVATQGRVLAKYTAEAELCQAKLSGRVQWTPEEWANALVRIVATATIVLGCSFSIIQMYRGKDALIGTVISAVATLLNRQEVPQMGARTVKEQIALAKALLIAEHNMTQIENAMTETFGQQPLDSEKTRALVEVVAYRNQLQAVLNPSAAEGQSGSHRHGLN